MKGELQEANRDLNTEPSNLGLICLNLHISTIKNGEGKETRSSVVVCCCCCFLNATLMIEEKQKKKKEIHPPPTDHPPLIKDII